MWNCGRKGLTCLGHKGNLSIEFMNRYLNAFKLKSWKCGLHISMKRKFAMKLSYNRMWTRHWLKDNNYMTQHHLSTLKKLSKLFTELISLSSIDSLVTHHADKYQQKKTVIPRLSISEKRFIEGINAEILQRKLQFSKSGWRWSAYEDEILVQYLEYKSECDSNWMMSDAVMSDIFELFQGRFQMNVIAQKCKHWAIPLNEQNAYTG